MSFATLATVRTAHLNPALGLDTDADPQFGSTAIRNAALQQAFAWLWPEMGRLRREDVTPTSGTLEYDLAAIRDIRQIDVLNSVGSPTTKIDQWRVYVDESDTANAPVIRLQLFGVQNTNSTLRVLGYSAYKVPASGTDTCDLPDRLLYIPALGATAYLYKNMLNKHITSQQRGSENPSTSESTNELLAMYQTSWQQFTLARQQNGTGLGLPRRAITAR